MPFYARVCGWTLTSLGDTDEFRYSTFGHSDEPAGGIYDARAALPDGVPSHWSLYLGVPDVADAAARVIELGGTVVREPWDSEFGTFSQVADPTGALFYLGEAAQGPETSATNPTQSREGSARSDVED